MSLTWAKQPLTQQLARALRAATRRHPSLDGHTFGFSDLKEMWAAEDVHVVLTHDHDKVWQYWFAAPEGGWQLRSVHPNRQAAQQAAQANTAPEDTLDGTFAMGRLPGGRWMRVRCSSPKTITEIVGVFERIGCATKVETIGEAA